MPKLEPKVQDILTGKVKINNLPEDEKWCIYMKYRHMVLFIHEAEGCMLIVDGFFENGVFVPEKPLTAITGRQRAVLNIDNTSETDEEKSAKRQKAFEHFSQYRGTLPDDFDYKKVEHGFVDEHPHRK